MKHSNIIRTLAVMLMAGAALVSCTKENAPVTGTFTMTVNASKGDNASKDLSLSGTTLTATWKTGEKVYVHNNTTNEDLGGYLEAQSDGENTTLKGNLTGTINEDDVLTLKFLSPNYGSQEGTIEWIAANCDYATATVTVTNASTTNVTTTNADFENQQAIVKFTLQNNASDLSASQFVVMVYGQKIILVKPTSATNVLYVAIPGFSGKNVSLTATTSNNFYAKTVSNITFANGQYYTVTVQMKSIPERAVGALFSVNDQGKQVWFSKGNLTYNKSNRIWNFMEKQPSTAESNNQNVGENYTSQNVVSLFGWGTSGVAGSATKYLPYETAPSASSHEGSDYRSDVTSGNLPQSLDWGHNAINSDIHSIDQWRIPTQPEWNYLFNNTARATCRFMRAQISHEGRVRYGVIIFPDNFGGIYNTNYNYNPIYYQGWAGVLNDWETMQAAGAVFLPAAGLRNGTVIEQWNNSCCYWTATSYSDKEAYYVYCKGNTFKADGILNRANGCSVRLIQDAN